MKRQENKFFLSPLYIGSRADVFTTLDGLLDDLRIYNEVLSAEDIMSLAGAEPPSPLPANLIQGVTATASSELGGGFTRFAIHAADRSGLDIHNGTHTIAPDGNMWLSGGCCGVPVDPEPEITFDLGGVVAVDRMDVWNYNETLAGREDELLGRGVQQADIYVSADGVDFTLVVDDLTLDRAPGDATVDFAQTVDLGGVQAQYVKFDISSNWANSPEGFYGLAEVAFYQVPEPGAGLLLAMGLVALIRKRQ